MTHKPTGNPRLPTHHDKHAKKRTSHRRQGPHRASHPEEPLTWTCSLCGEVICQVPGESAEAFNERVFDTHTGEHIRKGECPDPLVGAENLLWNQIHSPLWRE